MLDISARLFNNLSRNNGVTDTTTIALYGIVTLTFKFDLDLQATDLGPVRDTLSLCV
jgi:hypothetical protein